MTYISVYFSSRSFLVPGFFWGGTPQISEQEFSRGSPHGKSLAVTYFYLTVNSGLLRKEIGQIKFGLLLVSNLKLYLASKPYTTVLGPFSLGNIF
jgi:hypothetical protein